MNYSDAGAAIANRSDGDDEGVEKAMRQFAMVDATMLEQRTLTLFGEVNQDVARALCERLLVLAFRDEDAPINLLISSPGGHVESGDAIFDMIRFIKPQVRTIGTGWVGSIATHIYLSVDREHRYSLPNTRFLIHQPAGGMGGDASDIEIHAREIIKTRERINRIIADQTGQDFDKVQADTERDYWMSVEESQAYGLVGKVITSISELA